jgi:hypothetical protein
MRKDGGKTTVLAYAAQMTASLGGKAAGGSCQGVPAVMRCQLLVDEQDIDQAWQACGVGSAPQAAIQVISCCLMLWHQVCA